MARMSILLPSLRINHGDDAWHFWRTTQFSSNLSQLPVLRPFQSRVTQDPTFKRKGQGSKQAQELGEIQGWKTGEGGGSKVVKK